MTYLKNFMVICHTHHPYDYLTLKQNPLNFQVMLRCKTQYFQGYFNVEETVLDLWPCVKDAQVLPISIYVNSCVCPRNSSSKSAYCRLVAQNPIPAGK